LILGGTMTERIFALGIKRQASVNLIADERYNPLKSRTKEAA
jgi:hypothetical protein